MNADGSARRLISSEDIDDGQGGLTWSADGTRVAAAQGGDIYAFDVATGTKTAVVTGVDHDFLPEYSPDGRHLAWVQVTGRISNPYSGSIILMRAEADGSNPVALSEIITTGPYPHPGQPHWHPDGEKLEWEYRNGETLHHTRVSVDGILLQDVIDSQTNGWQPSPRGDRLVINSFASGTGRNYLASLDGTILSALPEPPAGSQDWEVSSWQARTDSLAPIVEIEFPAEGSETVLGSPLTAAYTCADEGGGSGLASCTGTADNGAALDTSAVGEKTFTVTATDNAGNTVTRTISYKVVWPFSNFVGSVDPLPTLNATKAGGVVPVRFSLGGDRGLNILAAGSPTSAQINCDLSAPVDLIEETAVSPGANALSYDAPTDRYAYNWKTNKAWKNTCRHLTFKLADGASYQANFRFS
ncbi:PxKF domain-containing protein [Arthrobacter sp. MDT3-24]